MDDRLYEKALRRRDELLKELDEVDAFIRVAERLLHERRHGADQGLGESSPTTSTPEKSQESHFRRRNPTPPARLAELAREEILAVGRPMTRGELVDALERRGIEIVAKDKAKNLGTILWRFGDKFVNMPGEGYWPTDVAPPGKLV